MELDLLVIGSGPGGQRPPSRPPSSASASPSPSAATASAASRSIPGRSRPRRCARRRWSSSPRARSTCSTRRGVEETERQAIQQLLDRAAAVVAAETAITREQFRRNHVGLLPGAARFEDDHTVRIDGTDEPVRAERIVIAVGTRPARPASVEFDDRTIIDSDGLLKLESRVPRTMTVVGAGVIGVEYASMFGALGTKVTVVDQRDRVLTFLDAEIGEAFQYLLRRRNVTFRLREKVDARRGAAGPRRAAASSPRARRSCPRPCSTRPAARATPTSSGSPTTGLETDKRGRIKVDENYRTARAAHLRRRRLRRRRRAGRDGDGAGPDRRAARVRPARQPAARADPDRRLRDPRAGDGRRAPRRS